MKRSGSPSMFLILFSPLKLTNELKVGLGYRIVMVKVAERPPPNVSAKGC